MLRPDTLVDLTYRKLICYDCDPKRRKTKSSKLHPLMAVTLGKDGIHEAKTFIAKKTVLVSVIKFVQQLMQSCTGTT